MAYDHEEQEQLATLKSWWSRNGNVVTWALIIVLAAYGAWAGWTVYQRNQAAQAGQFYEEFQRAVTAQDKEKVLRAAVDMQAKFPRTAYAEMTALGAAKYAFEANDLPTAKMQLQWVIDNGASDDYKAIAKVRLAGILLDEKAYDEGLKLLSGNFPVPFASVVDDRKGDIFVAQNKLEEARTAYQAALEKTAQKSPGRQLIQIKLDAIGGAVKKAA
jgi:predicted negative regulator of RcsB-dependent stress response